MDAARAQRHASHADRRGHQYSRLGPALVGDPRPGCSNWCAIESRSGPSFLILELRILTGAGRVATLGAYEFSF
jgi:hypothetical protein